MCKFIGTGFGADAVGAVRKALGARALQEDAMLGTETFLPNATSAAEVFGSFDSNSSNY